MLQIEIKGQYNVKS